MASSRLGSGVRAGVTIVAFAILLWLVDPREIVRAFAGVVWIWVIARIPPYVASLWLQAYRWRQFLALEGVVTDTNRLFRRVWMSRFFVNVMPGSLGGDLFRVVESSDFSHSRLAVARSVLLDRIVALASLAMYTSVACIGWGLTEAWRALLPVGLLGLVASLVGIWLLATQSSSRLLRNMTQRLTTGRVRDFMLKLADSLRDLAGQRRLLFGAAAISVLFNVTWAIGSYFGFLALNQSLSPLLVITLIPVVYALSAVPVSLNGLGVVEGVFVVVFTWCGLTPAAAAAVAIFLRVTGILLSSFGGVLYLMERRRLARPLAP